MTGAAILVACAELRCSMLCAAVRNRHAFRELNVLYQISDLLLLNESPDPPFVRLHGRALFLELDEIQRVLF